MFDNQKTSYKPQAFKKGDDVKIKFVGSVTANIVIKNMHIHADWNGSAINDHDIKQDKSFNDQYLDEIDLNLPIYTPTGHYVIKFTGTGQAE